MNTSTTHPAPQLALITLSEAATPGPWTVRNNGLWLIEAPGPLGESWVVAEAVEGINIDDVDHTESNARFIAAAVNHFRATQSRPEAELPELPEPIGLIAGTRIQPQNEFFGYFNAGYTGENKEHVFTADQLRAYGQQCAVTRQTVEVSGLEACVQHGNSWLAVQVAGKRVVVTVPVEIASAVKRAATRPAEVGGDGVGELVSEIQFAVNDIFPPETMTEARQEYWKAGARAAIHAVNAAIEKYRTAHVNGSEVGP